MFPLRRILRSFKQGKDRTVKEGGMSLGLRDKVPDAGDSKDLIYLRTLTAVQMAQLLK